MYGFITLEAVEHKLYENIVHNLSVPPFVRVLLYLNLGHDGFL